MKINEMTNEKIPNENIETMSDYLLLSKRLNVSEEVRAQMFTVLTIELAKTRAELKSFKMATTMALVLVVFVIGLLTFR